MFVSFSFNFNYVLFCFTDQVSENALWVLGKISDKLAATYYELKAVIQKLFSVWNVKSSKLNKLLCWRSNFENKHKKALQKLSFPSTVSFRKKTKKVKIARKWRKEISAIAMERAPRRACSLLPSSQQTSSLEVPAPATTAGTVPNILIYIRLDIIIWTECFNSFLT